MSDTIEQFYWKGQLRFRCPKQWESGAQCEYNTYDLEALHAHIASPHSRSGKPAKQREQVVSPLVDHEGKPIVHERRAEPEVPEEFRGFKFKE